MKRVLSIAVMMLAALTISQSAWAGEIVVTGNNVRLRMQPSLNANTLIYTATGLNVHVNKGDRFTCYGHSNGFCNIYYDGHSVWVSSQYTRHLDSYSSSSSSSKNYNNSGYHPDWVTVQGNGVRLRKSPSLKGAIYTQVNRGTQLRCIGASGNFWQVNYRGNYLWISKDFAF